MPKKGREKEAQVPRHKKAAGGSAAGAQAMPQVWLPDQVHRTSIFQTHSRSATILSLSTT